jgi:hypothetical protein
MNLQETILQAIRKTDIYQGHSSESAYEIPFDFNGIEFYVDIDVIINVYPSSTNIEIDKFEVFDGVGNLIMVLITEQQLIDVII